MLQAYVHRGQPSHSSHIGAQQSVNVSALNQLQAEANSRALSESAKKVVRVQAGVQRVHRPIPNAQAVGT